MPSRGSGSLSETEIQYRLLGQHHRAIAEIYEKLGGLIPFTSEAADTLIGVLPEGIAHEARVGEETRETVVRLLQRIVQERYVYEIFHRILRGVALLRPATLLELLRVSDPTEIEARLLSNRSDKTSFRAELVIPRSDATIPPRGDAQGIRTLIERSFKFVIAIALDYEASGTWPQLDKDIFTLKADPWAEFLSEVSRQTDVGKGDAPGGN